MRTRARLSEASAASTSSCTPSPSPTGEHLHAPPRVEFRWGVFNLFNHTNYGTPDSNISNMTVGTITTADEGRNMQFGLRFVW